MTVKLQWSNNPSRHGSGWVIMLQHVSRHVTHPWIQSWHWRHGYVGSIPANIVSIVMTREDMLPTFPTKLKNETGCCASNKATCRATPPPQLNPTWAISQQTANLKGQEKYLFDGTLLLESHIQPMLLWNSSCYLNEIDKMPWEQLVEQDFKRDCSHFSVTYP